MKYNSFDIKRLLDVLAEKTKTSLVRSHFQIMHDLMEKSGMKNLFSEDYLYRKIFLRVKNATAENNKPISLNTQNIEMIATFIGYSSGYNEFLILLNQPVNKQLESCVGSWYSYVRCNSGEEYVLTSPVIIYRESNEIFLELKGAVRKFKGKLKLEGNCIYCLLESKQDKNLYFVLSIGFAEKPDVLQGVFSGMSTAGDPIAGREVLIRQEEKSGTLKNSRRSIEELIKSKSEEEKTIGMYFRETQQTILKAGHSSTFGLDDLKKNNRKN